MGGLNVWSLRSFPFCFRGVWLSEERHCWASQRWHLSHGSRRLSGAQRTCLSQVLAHFQQKNRRIPRATGPGVGASIVRVRERIPGSELHRA